MNLCMAATYDPDPRAPLGFRIPFNAESGEAIEERWRNWRRHDPIHLVSTYKKNLKSLRGIYIDYRMDASLPFLYKALKG